MHVVQSNENANSSWLSAFDIDPTLLFDHDGLKQAADFFDNLAVNPTKLNTATAMIPRNILDRMQSSWNALVETPDFPLPTTAVGPNAKLNFDVSMHKYVSKLTSQNPLHMLKAEDDVLYDGTKYSDTPSVQGNMIGV